LHFKKVSLAIDAVLFNILTSILRLPTLLPFQPQNILPTGTTESGTPVLASQLFRTDSRFFIEFYFLKLSSCQSF